MGLVQLWDGLACLFYGFSMPLVWLWLWYAFGMAFACPWYGFVVYYQGTGALRTRRKQA